MSDNWPVGIPRDYNELHRSHGDYIAYLCARYGRADHSPEDLFQHIWEKLLQVDILGKYVSSLQLNTIVPDTVSTLEACALLGIGFGAWRSAHWSYQVIFKKVLGGKAPVGGKNRGITRIRNARGERWVSWMPEPILPKEDPASGKKPKVIGPVSMKARFVTKQVILLAEMNYFKGICVNLPTPTATPAHFKNYLRRALANHFKNWVRTKKRRHKERPADLFSQFRDPDGEGFGMEDKLVDPHATEQMEAKADIGQVLGRARTPELLAHRDELFNLLEDGYTLVEAVRKLNLSPKTQRAVHHVVNNLV